MDASSDVVSLFWVSHGPTGRPAAIRLIASHFYQFMDRHIFDKYHGDYLYIQNLESYAKPMVRPSLQDVDLRLLRVFLKLDAPAPKALAAPVTEPEAEAAEAAE